MPPYVTRIVTKCGDCLSPATHALRATDNQEIGRFCWKHATERLRRLQQEERNHANQAKSV